MITSFRHKLLHSRGRDIFRSAHRKVEEGRWRGLSPREPDSICADDAALSDWVKRSNSFRPHLPSAKPEIPRSSAPFKTSLALTRPRVGDRPAYCNSRTHTCQRPSNPPCPNRLPGFSPIAKMGDGDAKTSGADALQNFRPNRRRRPRTVAGACSAELAPPQGALTKPPYSSKPTSNSRFRRKQKADLIQESSARRTAANPDGITQQLFCLSFSFRSVIQPLYLHE
jgi:hypothetical protein